VGSKLSLLLLSLVFTMARPAAGQNTATLELKNDDIRPKPKLEWALAMGGISYEHGKDNEGAAFFYGNLNFDYRFTPWMRAYLSPRMSIFSARVQERFGDSSDSSRVWMSDGYVAVDPIEYFELRAGALNQRFHGTSMLVSGLRSFPGVQQIGKIEIGEIKAQVILQQVIPTSHSLNDSRETQEKLPTFMTQTLQLSGEHFGFFQWGTKAGLYDWSNIPAKVISESRLVGNVGTGENVGNSQFLYDHQGWFLSSAFCLCPSSWLGGVVEFERVHNQAAPSHSADAQMIGIGPKIQMGNLELDLRVRQYFIESDATVAAYSKSRYGNTNRRGYNVEATLNFKKERFAIFAEGYQAEPINRDPNQRDLAVYLLGVETAYAPF